jgi:uncharacterized membrane protein
MRRASIIACALGLLLSLHLGLERFLPWGGGCPQGWIFNCHVVRQSAASVFLGLPLWAWGGGWFLLVGALTLGGLRRSAPVPTAVRAVVFALVTLGWMKLTFLRGVEAFVLHAACLQCWLVAVCGFVAGLAPLMVALRPLSRGRRRGGLVLVAAGMIGSFFAATLLPEPPPPPEPEDIEIPGWEMFRSTSETPSGLEFRLCGPGVPTLLLVYDPDCPDCHALIEGPLADEEIQLVLTDCCRVVTLFSDVEDAPLMDGVWRTPALILLSDEGDPVEILSGAIDAEEILALVEQAYML